MAVERSDFELGVISDPRAIKQFLGELEVIPAALKRVASAINAVDLGDGRKFQGDGRVLAEGLIQGFRGQLAGGSFQRAFREAMSGVDLRIPAEAQAHLRSDLQRIAAEVESILPKQVLIGVRANTTPEQFRQAIPQAFQQPQQIATGVSLAQAREEARQLRAQNDARQAELGTARNRTQGDSSANEILKSNGLVDKTSERYQAAAARLSEATAAGARTIERVATREETRAKQEATFPGGPDAREGALSRATEDARTLRAQRQLGLEASQFKLETPFQVGPSEPIQSASFRAFLARQAKLADDQAAQAQKLGSLQSKAGREMEAAINKQHEAALKENAAVDKAKALTDPNSSESVLQRAAQTSVNRRIAAQRALEDTTTPLGQKLQGADIGNLVEQDVARRLQGAALAQQRRDQGPLGQVTAGVFGTSGASFLERQSSIISTTASFAVGGKIFEAVLSGISEVVNGTRQFEEALSRLSIMFNDSTSNLRGFATEVGAAANNVGLTQAQGIEVASKSVGLFNTSQLSEQDKKDFALQATEVTARISQQSGGTDLVETETNLAGILRSFQLSNSDLTRVEDALAVISKQFGHAPGDVLKATAETGTLANEAGFDPFTAAAIIANQATTTGQSASASATQVAQLFSKETNQNIESHFQQIGIDTTKTLADQFTQLQQKVQSGAISRNELDTMASLFGRSRAGGALLNLVDNLPRINAVAAEARNSPGEGQKQFEQEFGNINGEIRRTVGALKQMATELSQSGLLDILGELIYVIHQGADALTELLHLFNELSRPLRSAALQLTELGVAIRLIGGAGAVSKAITLLASVSGGGTGVGQAALTRLGATGLAERTAALSAERVAAKGAIQGVIPGLEAAGGAAAGGSGAGAAGIAGLLANPIVLGAVAAATALIAGQKIDDANRAADRAEATAGQAAASAKTAEDLRGAASSRRTAANAEDSRRGAFLGLGNVVDFFTGHDAARTASQDRRLADSLDQHAGDVAKSQAAAAQANTQLFGRFQSPDDVANQLQRLSAEGFTAAQRVKALSDAFDEISHAANKAGSAIIPAGGKDVFTQGFASAVSGALGSGAQQAGLRSQAANALDNGNFFSNRAAAIVEPFAALVGQAAPFNPGEEKAFGDLQKKLGGVDTGKVQGDVQGAINKVLADRHIDTSKGDTVLSKDDVAAIQSAANGVLQNEILSLIPSDKKFDEIRRIIQDSFRINISGTIKQFTQGALSPDQAVNFVQNAFTEANNTFNETSFKDRASASATRIKTQKSALDKAKEALGSQGNDEGDKSKRSDSVQRLGEAQIAYDQALVEDQKVQLEKTQSLIHLRESKRGSLDQSGRLADEIDAATAAVTATASGDPNDHRAAIIQLNNLKEQQAQLVVESAASVANSKIDPRNTGALAQQAVANAQANLTFAKGHGDKKAIADATTALAQANVQNLQTQISIANAQRSANVPIGDNVAAATAELTNARATLGSEIKGTEAYYNELSEIKRLEKQLADTKNARLNDQRLLRIDLTDPVAQAHAAVQAAQDALRSAQGPDDRNKATLDLRQKQASEEAAKFQQRLSDVQTADNLGRISHQQYMTFLQSEHDRLQTRLKTLKTTDTGYRQAVDELNQIDGLIKEAGTALSGQFNLSDIKLPTVYEVRRAIKAGVGGIQGANNGFAGAGVGQVVTDNSQHTLVLNGVPLEEVMKRIYQLYGGKPVRTTTTRKR